MPFYPFQVDVDHAAITRDRKLGMSLTEIAKAHGISRSLGNKIRRAVRMPFEISASQEHRS